MNVAHTSNGARPRKKIQKGEGLWLMSFSDMVLILLCFFLLLLSTMKTDNQKFADIKEGMTHRKYTDENNLTLLEKKLKQLIHDKELDEFSSVKHDVDGLHVEFRDGFLFESGSAKPNHHNQLIIEEVLQAISSLGPQYHMVIEGHTDDTPLAGGGISAGANWELSASRGFTLLREFVRLGIDENRMSVVAYAATKPKVQITNLKGEDLKAARSANRRVVIWIE